MIYAYLQLIFSLVVFALSSYIIVTRISLRSRVVVKIALLSIFAYSVFSVGNAVNLMSVLLLDYVFFAATMDLVKLMYVVQLIGLSLLLYADFTRRESYGDPHDTEN